MELERFIQFYSKFSSLMWTMEVNGVHQLFG